MAKRSATLVTRSGPSADDVQCCPSVFAAPLESSEAEELASGFSALGDPMRIQIVNILAGQDEVCVCDFVEPLGRAQPTVSHHLKVLAEAGLVHGERRGKWVYYSLDRARLAALRTAIGT